MSVRVFREGSLIVVEDCESAIEIPLDAVVDHIRAIRSAAGPLRTACKRKRCHNKVARCGLCRKHYDAKRGVVRYVRRGPGPGAPSDAPRAKDGTFVARRAVRLGGAA